MPVKTTEQKIAAIDAKIERVRRDLDHLYEVKKKLMHPLTRKTVLEKAISLGMSPEEMAERLGILDI